ncbi:MAG: hypothetical protein ACK2UC_01550 [Anaerolineae bacterium]|jgi:ABC-type tungstate transport system permease subunit
MGAVLTMADEQQAYTLSDRATYLARTLEGTDLANQFIGWLISVPAQEKIGQFSVDEFGALLFTPDSEP